MRRNKMLVLAITLLVLPVTVTLTDAQQQSAVTQTKGSQKAITPKQALQMLKNGNQRFVDGQMLHRVLSRQVKETAGGQYPFAVILGCMDSGTAPGLVFDQGLGDIFGLRVAGNTEDEHVLGSMEYATKVAGARLMAVIGHSGCGAVKGACDHVKLGNLTELLNNIKPAVDGVHEPARPADRTSRNQEFVEGVAEMNVRLTMKRILQKSPEIKQLVESGQVGPVAGMYDLETGKVHLFED